MSIHNDYKNGSSGIAVVLSALLGQGPAYIAFVGWALAQQLSIPRQFRKTHKNMMQSSGQTIAALTYGYYSRMK